MHRPGASQTVTHKTGIPIAALDISPQRTHAVIAGKDILKTIRVSPDHSSEEFNLRNAIISYSSTHRHVTSGSRYRDQLTVRDVKWSHGPYDNVIATAVANGRIVAYDLLRPGLELCRFQGHSRQVHRLAFNPNFPAWLLSGSQDSSIRLWDLRVASADRGVSTCGSTELYNGNSDAVRDVRWSPNDGFTFATATDSGAIQLWDYRKANAPVMRIAAHDKPCFSVDWHPDGKHIASAGTDRQVKVWDFSSSAERRQKPTFQFRCPQAVLSLRWRPPSWAGESPGSGPWQSSQIVTSYDKDDPRVHLWDLRRPHVPFREFDRYDSCATDLLWHSKDLLWTVGDSGIFTQTDIRYAPQVIHRRPTCSVAWSPSGEALAFVQKRPNHRVLGANAAEFLGYHKDDSTSEGPWSQTPTDDISDESTNDRSTRHRRRKSGSTRQSKSRGNSPPGTPGFNPVVSLEMALPKGKAPAAHQPGAVGSIPGATMDAALFRYLARHYSSLMDDFDDGKELMDPLQSLLQSLDNNAERAEDASLLQLAQTWRIVKFAAVQALQRAPKQERQLSKKCVNDVNEKSTKESQPVEKSRALEDSRSEKAKSRLFKGVTGVEGRRSPFSETDSVSNTATPLAQPLPESTENGSSNHFAGPGGSVPDMEPLPPSVSSQPATTASSDWTMSDFDDRAAAQPGQRQSQSSEDVLAPSEQYSSYRVREAIAQGLQDEQRSVPWKIAVRADWRDRESPDLQKGASYDDEYDQKMEDKKAAIRDYRSFPKNILSLETPAEYTKTPAPRGHDSGESFPMFSASTDSSNRAKSILASFSPKHPALGTIDDDDGDDDVDKVSSGDDATAAGDSILSQGGEEGLGDDMSLDESFVDNGNVHLERPSSPPQLLKEARPLSVFGAKSTRQTTLEIAHPAVPGITEDLSERSLPISPDLTGSDPWGVEIMLKEAIRHYYSNTLVDIQTAAHLLHKLHLLFDGCAKILPHEECELIYKTYNEHLIRQSMYVEAAELRLLCVPSYPDVYEYAQAETFANVFCFTCKRPYENPRQDNRRCYRCNTPQEACAICMSMHPPPEWTAAVELSAPSSDLDDDRRSETTSPLSTRSSAKTEPLPPSEVRRLDEPRATAPRPKGTALWSWCQGCGHGGHVACMAVWLGDISFSEGACATPGCFHDCGPGPRREQNRASLLEEAKRRDSASRRAGLGYVTRDPWAKGESRAVEKVRGMLSIAPGSGAGGGASITSATALGPGSSSGRVSPKKVRLVTPTEQGRRRGGSGRASNRGASASGG